ncbi:MAG: VanZ family protein [Chthoniobacteraceae bacterium]|nr:VanZ family protein [Chthoniobacteraceae bacterium]
MSRFRLGAWSTVAAWVLTIFILSSLSGSQVEHLNVFRLWDKAAHFIAFAAGGFVLGLALRVSTAWSSKKVTLVTIAVISLFGATDEWHQLYTPHRSGADRADWLADTFGAAVGAFLIASIYARYQRKDCPAPPSD